MAYSLGLDRPSRPGVVVFNLSHDVLYMNQEALELSQALWREAQLSEDSFSIASPQSSDQGSPDHEAETAFPDNSLPLEITQICEEVASRLQARADAKDWGQVYVRRTVEHQSRQLVLQGFGIPDAGSMPRSVIIVLLESRVAHRPENEQAQPGGRIAEARARFRLTDRELEVSEHLAKGLTNKEIATLLGITEQTIKVHVKHIMEKTEATTRTGVLAQLYQVPSHPAWNGRKVRRHACMKVSSLSRRPHRASGNSPAGKIAALALAEPYYDHQ